MGKYRCKEGRERQGEIDSYTWKERKTYTQKGTQKVREIKDRNIMRKRDK